MEWKNRIVNYLLIAFLGISLWILIREWGAENFNIVILVSASVFAVSLAISLILYNRKVLRKEERYLVIMEEDRISCLHPEKPDESILWREISEVVIVTTNKGPYEPYIWILLVAENGQGCVFPLGAKNSRIAIEKILGFPGLNLAVWANALKSTGNDRFVVWKRQA